MSTAVGADVSELQRRRPTKRGGRDRRFSMKIPKRNLILLFSIYWLCVPLCGAVDFQCTLENIAQEWQPFSDAAVGIAKINLDELDDVRGIYRTYDERTADLRKKISDANENATRIMREDQEKAEKRGNSSGRLTWRARSALQKFSDTKERLTPRLNYLYGLRDVDVLESYRRHSERRFEYLKVSGISDESVRKLGEIISTCPRQLLNSLGDIDVRLGASSGKSHVICAKYMIGQGWSDAKVTEVSSYSGGEVNRIFGSSIYDGRQMFMVIPRGAGKVSIIPFPEMFGLVDGMIYYAEDQTKLMWRYSQPEVFGCY